MRYINYYIQLQTETDAFILRSLNFLFQFLKDYDIMLSNQKQNEVDLHRKQRRIGAKYLLLQCKNLNLALNLLIRL